MNKGTVKQIIGPVVDVYFEKDLPKIHTAREIEKAGKNKIVLEVAGHLGLNRVRCVAMYDTAGLKRGMSVLNTGKPISVPVGE